MLPRRPLLAGLLALPAAARAQPAARPPARPPARKVHIGQATPAISFLPLMAARALDTFPAQDLDLFWADIPGGDPACLAALGNGDLDFAAVGSESLLSAIGKGQPVQMAYSLMSKVSLELVMSNKRIEAAGIAPADDPVAKRLQALKGATVGVSAIGGTQDRAVRWLARQAGLDPRKDIGVVMVGPPPAIQAALDAGRIDAYVLSPPEGLLSEDARTGQVVVRMGSEFPALQGIPSLVLAVKTPVADDTRALLVGTCKAMQDACTRLLADPAAAAAAIGDKLFPRIKPPVIAAAVKSLASGIQPRGRFDEAGIAALLAYAGDAATGPDVARPFWTNEYWDEAAK